MGRVCRGVWVVVALLPVAVVAQPAEERGPHFGVYLGAAGGGTTGENPRSGGGVGVLGELGVHLAPDWELSLIAGAHASVDSSLLQAALVAHRSFGDEFLSLGAGLGVFSLPGQATAGLLVPVELDLLPIFFPYGRPLFGLGIKLQLSPGVDFGTGRFVVAGGLHLAALVVD